MTIEGDDNIQFEISNEAFRVVDASSANWVVRRVVESRKYKERVQVWAATEIRRAEREQRFFLDRWGAQLEEWARAQIAEQHRRKSISLPAGTVGLRIEPQRIDIQDETRVLAWCRINLPAAIKQSEAILKSVVMEHLKTHGELPPGTEIGGGKEQFFIR